MHDVAPFFGHWRGEKGYEKALPRLHLLPRPRTKGASDTGLVEEKNGTRRGNGTEFKWFTFPRRSDPIDKEKISSPSLPAPSAAHPPYCLSPVCQCLLRYASSSRAKAVRPAALPCPSLRRPAPPRTGRCPCRGRPPPYSPPVFSHLTFFLPPSNFPRRVAGFRGPIAAD